MPAPECLSVLAFMSTAGPDEPPVWCAQVLEYDMAAQAPTYNGLSAALASALAGHVAVARLEKMEPWACPPAPEGFRQLWPMAVPAAEIPAEEWKDDDGTPIEVPRMAIRCFSVDLILFRSNLDASGFERLPTLDELRATSVPVVDIEDAVK